MTRLEDIPSGRVADAVARAVVDAVTNGGDTETIVARALERARTELGLQPGSTQSRVRRPPADLGPNPASAGQRTILTEDDVRSAVAGGQPELRVPPGSLVTPLARDAAADAGLRLVEER